MKTIRKISKLYVPILAGLFLLLTLGASPASATTCSGSGDDGGCSIDLTVTNGSTGLPAGTVYGTVTLTLDGGYIDVVINNIPSGSGQGYFGSGSIGAFAFNGVAGVSLSGTPTYTFTGTDPNAPTWGTSLSEDGFGVFQYGLQGGNGSNSDYISLSFVLQLNGGGNFTTVDQIIAGSVTGGSGKVNPNNWFSAHLSLGNNCTGYIGNTGSTGGTGGFADAAGNSCGAVPEPATLTLFGSGLVALGGLIRRRRKQTVA